MPDPAALARFAQDFEQLKAQRLPQKVGVMVPTCNRPDLARLAVLQFAHQSLPPDVICVHQNGPSDTYQWAVDDLKVQPRVVWLQTRETLPQHDGYAIPLRWLIDAHCTHFFWADHDDLVLHSHIEAGVADLQDADFSVTPRAGLLFTHAKVWRFNPEVDFSGQAPGGLASTMCFNRRFALQLLADLAADQVRFATHKVIADVTRPRFRCKVSERRTCIHHAHEGSMTSAAWLAQAIGGEFGDVTSSRESP